MEKKKIRLTGKFREVKISYREQGEDKINNHSSRSLGNEITCITIETDEPLHVEGLDW